MGVAIVFTIQVTIRVLRDLPALYRVEAQSDLNAARQVMEALRAPVRILETLVLEYSIWDATYEFVEMTPDSREWTEYLDLAFEIPFDTFFLHDINGVIFLDSDGSLVYRLTLDLDNGNPIPGLDLTSFAVREILTTRYRSPLHPALQTDPAIINSGFVQTDRGTVFFASSEIHRTV